MINFHATFVRSAQMVEELLHLILLVCKQFSDEPIRIEQLLAELNAVDDVIIWIYMVFKEQ